MDGVFIGCIYYIASQSVGDSSGLFLLAQNQISLSLSLCFVSLCVSFSCLLKHIELCIYGFELYLLSSAWFFFSWGQDRGLLKRVFFFSSSSSSSLEWG